MSPQHFQDNQEIFVNVDKVQSPEPGDWTLSKVKEFGGGEIMGYCLVCVLFFSELPSQ